MSERFDQGGGESEPKGLWCCPYCAGDMMYPLEYTEEVTGWWQILLRCPDCEQVDQGVYPQSAVDRLEDEQDRATNEFLDTIEKFHRVDILVLPKDLNSPH